MINRKAIHALLDTTLDAMVRLGEEAYVAFDINSITSNIRVSSPRNAAGWEIFQNLAPSEIDDEYVKEITRKLNDVSPATTTMDESWMRITIEGEKHEDLCL